MRKALEPRPTQLSGNRIVFFGERPHEWARHLDSEEHFGAFGQNGDADEVLEVIGRHRPDVVLLRIPAKGKAWIQLLQRIRSVHLHIKILAVSERIGASYADRALRAGANGCVVEGEGIDEISAAIRDVVAGHIYVSESFLAAKPKIGAKISRRKRQNSSPGAHLRWPGTVASSPFIKSVS